MGSFVLGSNGSWSKLKNFDLWHLQISSTINTLQESSQLATATPISFSLQKNYWWNEIFESVWFLGKNWWENWNSSQSDELDCKIQNTEFDLISQRGKKHWNNYFTQITEKGYSCTERKWKWKKEERKKKERKIIFSFDEKIKLNNLFSIPVIFICSKHPKTSLQWNSQASERILSLLHRRRPRRRLRPSQ